MMTESISKAEYDKNGGSDNALQFTRCYDRADGSRGWYCFRVIGCYPYQPLAQKEI